MYLKDRSDSEFRLVPLAADVEYQAAQATVADAEKAILTAEQRYRAAQVPAQERAAWREVEDARKALAKAGERLDEIKSRKSAEVCTASAPSISAACVTCSKNWKASKVR
jgi:hypothetical protein